MYKYEVSNMLETDLISISLFGRKSFIIMPVKLYFEYCHPALCLCSTLGVCSTMGDVQYTGRIS